MATRLNEKTRAKISSEKLSTPKILLDNDTTRITFHRIKPGQQSGWHRHEHDYVGYHFQGSEVHVDLGEGKAGSIQSQAEKATFYEVAGGFEHNVTVLGDTDLVALEIEYKKSRPPVSEF